MSVGRCIVVLAVLLGGVRIAAADPAADARAHFQAGETHYRAARYQEAITEYEAAYAAEPLPALLFNIAQAYRLDGKAAQAIDYYQRFLDASPDGRAAEAARAHIVALGGVPSSASTRPEGPAPASSTDQEPARPIAESPPSRSVLPTATMPAVAAPDLTVDDRPKRARGRALRLAGVGTAAAGVLLSGTAIYFGLRARSLSDEISDFDGGTWMTALDDKIRAGEAAERNAVIFGIAGGAAVTAGAILYMVGRRNARESSIALIPSPQGAQLVAAGHF